MTAAARAAAERRAHGLHLEPSGASGAAPRGERILPREDAAARSVRLEEQHARLSCVEVYVVLRLVRHVRAEIPPHDAVPHPIVLFDKQVAHVLSHLLLGVERLERLEGDVERRLLHVGRHVAHLDHRLRQRHGCSPPATARSGPGFCPCAQQQETAGGPRAPANDCVVRPKLIRSLRSLA
eukprot:6625933-Prymnesium_polylepis.1